MGRGVNIGKEGRISPEKKLDVVSVAVWMGGRVIGELLRDRQCDEGGQTRTQSERSKEI